MSERTILLIRHRITVDGKVVYEGSDYGIAGRGNVYRIALDYIQDSLARNVLHQVLKQIVPAGTDLRTVVWQWASTGHDPVSR